MAQTYSLEEAAQRLGITPDEMKRRLKEDWKAVRSFRDGSNLRFRAQEIDELARTLGLGSDPDHPPSAKNEDAPLAMADAVGAQPKAGEPSGDYFRLADDATSVEPPSGRSKPDSDVRVEAAPSHKPGSKPRAKPASSGEIDLDAESGATEADLPIPPQKSGSSKRAGSSAQRKAQPKTPSPRPAPNQVEGGSDFELKLDDSSDEFELSLDSSDEEVDLGGTPGKRAGDSGINLQSPSDSGVSLEKASDSEIDFELSLDPVGSSSASSHRIKSPKPNPVPDSDSEFELTLDSEGELAPVDEATGEQKDIFETDFEIPALDEESASEAVALEEGDTDLDSSDFDLAAAEEASDEDAPAVTVEQALPKGRGRRRDGDEEGEHWAGLEEDEEEGEAPAVVATPAQWGLLPALVMIPCVIVLFITGLMGYELLRGMWGYQTGGAVSGPVVRGLAPLFGDAGKEAAKQK